MYFNENWVCITTTVDIYSVDLTKVRAKLKQLKHLLRSCSRCATTPLIHINALDGVMCSLAKSTITLK